MRFRELKKEQSLDSIYNANATESHVGDSSDENEDVDTHWTSEIKRLRELNRKLLRRIIETEEKLNRNPR